MKRETETVEKRTCILVLGMHRSGTSALTRVLNIAGAALPKRLLGASDISNATGHWEPDALAQYHDRLLAELGSSWYDWRPLDLGSLPVKRREEISQEISDIIRADYGNEELIVLKDPRICRFAPFFFDVLQDAGFDISPVITFRNPLEVCESLERRDGMKRADAALLWLRHVLDAESATRNLKRTIVSYNHLLNDWKAIFAKLTKQSGLKNLYSIEEIEPQVEEFLSPANRHHAHKTEDVLLDPLLRDWVGAAYQALLVLARNPGSIKATDQLDAIAGQFNNASPVLHRLYDTVRAERRDEVEGLKLAKDVLSSEISGFKEALSSYEQKTAEFEREAGELRQALSGAESKRAELTAALSGHEEESAVLKAALSEARSKTEELEARLSQAQGEASQLEATLAQRGEEVLELKKANDAHEGEIGEIKATLEQAESKTVELTSTLSKKEQETAGLKAELAQQRRLTTGVKSALTKLKKKTEQFKIEQNEAKNRETEFETNLLQVQGEASQLEATLAQRGVEIEEISTARVEQETRMRALEEAFVQEKEALSVQLQEKEVALGTERGKVGGLEVELSTIRQELQQIQQDLASAKKETEDYRNSTSWKLTKPLRAIGGPVKRLGKIPSKIKQTTKTIRTGIAMGGGFVGVSKKSLRILKTGGVDGILLRIRNVSEDQARLPEQRVYKDNSAIPNSEDLNRKVAALENIRTVEANILAYKQPEPKPILDVAKLKEGILGKNSKQLKRIILSVTHDNYTKVLGGVQLCVQIEQKEVSRPDTMYFNLHPYYPLPVMSREIDSKNFLFRGIIDGVEIGVFRASDLLELIPEIRHQGIEFGCIIHALLGHSPEILGKIIIAGDVKNSIFWVHDYFSVCPSVTLLRNGITYCNAPDYKSTACSVCNFGEERFTHLARMEKLFHLTTFDVLSPSQFALNLWKQSSSLKYRRASIAPHCEIIDNKDSRVGHKKRQKRPVRIAFLGQQVDHKGWSVFRELSSKFSKDSRYKFVHLGQRSFSVDNIRFFPVSVSGARRNAMVQAILNNDIDVVLLWSIWPETFCFTYFEALTGHALVITNPESGNIQAMSKDEPNCITVESVKNLIELLEGDNLTRLIDSESKSSLVCQEMMYSSMSKNFI